MKVIFTVTVLLLIGLISAKPKKTADDTFHDQTHEGKDHEHNPDYDHEAFVGKDAAPEYDELPPEESKKRLGDLFHKVDKDGDSKVTEAEMIEWIKFTQNRYIVDDSEKQMKDHDRNKDGKIDFEEYKNSTYGEYEDDADEGDSFKEMVVRDKRRFTKADSDADGSLNKEEYTAFLHPENDVNMREVVVQETLDDIDKDKDGFISKEEYVGDLWPEEEQKSGEPEPDWVASEKEQFDQYRDKNKDGKMDASEVADWIMPEDMDHVTSEAKHLISESDADQDGFVTKEEMVEKYDLYVGSQATDFGEALKKDEL